MLLGIDARLFDRGRMKILADEARLREGLRQQDGREAVSVADVGDADAVL